jgi:photosystem II stability/assembly factor-like uncharacterized protein
MLRVPSAASAQSNHWEVIGRFQASYGLNSIVFCDSLHGWTAYFADSLYRTSDGGSSWALVSNTFLFKINALAMLDTLTIWGFGNDNQIGYIISSTDGGKIWRKKYEGFGDLLIGGAVLSSQTIIASGVWRAPNSPDTGLILCSSNGGASWKRTYIPSTQWMGPVQKVDSVTAITSFLPLQLLLRTTDAGASWQELNVPGAGSALTFLDRNRGILHRPPEFMRTWDGGAHWAVTADLRDSLGNPPFDDFSSSVLSFPDSLYGWAIGGEFYRGGISEGIYHTSDGGYTWKKESEGLTGNILHDGLMIDRTHGWAVAYDGQILAYKRLADAISEQAPKLHPDEFALYQNYPNPFNGQTTFIYNVASRTYVTFKIYDLLGRMVSTLVDNVQESGAHLIRFQADHLASGVYLARLSSSAGVTRTTRIILLR